MTGRREYATKRMDSSLILPDAIARKSIKPFSHQLSLSVLWRRCCNHHSLGAQRKSDDDDDGDDETNPSSARNKGSRK